MATFITMIKFTPEGMAKIHDTIKRAETFRTVAQKHGAKVIGEYWSMGAFDGLLIFEAADDQAASALLFHLASEGYVQTQTARAFTASEMEKILKMTGK
jgi:uncharacterized protein with GYD domain